MRHLKDENIIDALIRDNPETARVEIVRANALLQEELIEIMQINIKILNELIKSYDN